MARLAQSRRAVCFLLCNQLQVLAGCRDRHAVAMQPNRHRAVVMNCSRALIGLGPLFGSFIQRGKSFAALMFPPSLFIRFLSLRLDPFVPNLARNKLDAMFLKNRADFVQCGRF